jgi:hypothetical protein
MHTYVLPLSTSDINRVDVSLDGGKNFTRAELLPAPVAQRRGSKWGWTFFEREIPLPAELVAQAKQGKTFELELTSKVCTRLAWPSFHDGLDIGSLSNRVDFLILIFEAALSSPICPFL